MNVQRRFSARSVAAAIALWLALITVATLIVRNSALAIGFLSLFAICAAAYRFGRQGMLVVAAVSTVLFVAGEVLNDTVNSITGMERLLLATGSRVVVFFGVGLLVTELLRRQDRLVRTIVERERELDEIAAIRDALTPPTLPAVPGLELASSYAPAEQGVAGDFFLVVPRSDGSTVMAIGDVVGHGLEAGRRAAFARTTIAALAVYAPDPCELLRLANVALHDSSADQVEFVTVTCVCISPESGFLEWSQAGHPPPLDLDTGEPLAAYDSSPPLGVDPELTCVSHRVTLGAGKGFLLFSDGLIEARAASADRDSPFFGEARVRDQIRSLGGRPPQEVVTGLTEAVRRFAGSHLPDDLTLLAARRAPAQESVTGVAHREDAAV